MTALVKGRLPVRRATAKARQFPVAAAVVCWEGGMAALTAAGANSVLTPASADATLKVVGVMSGTADNRIGAAGAIKGDVDVDVFLMNNSPTDPVTIGDIGKSCFAEDDNTISKTGAPSGGSPTQPVAGKVFDIDPSGGVWVDFR